MSSCSGKSCWPLEDHLLHSCLVCATSYTTHKSFASDNRYTIFLHSWFSVVFPVALRDHKSCDGSLHPRLFVSIVLYCMHVQVVTPPASPPAATYVNFKSCPQPNAAVKWNPPNDAPPCEAGRGSQPMHTTPRRKRCMLNQAEKHLNPPTLQNQCTKASEGCGPYHLIIM
jgi:hypothetical protein